MQMNNKIILLIFLIVLILILILRSCSINNKLQESVSLYETTQSDLLLSRDKLGRQQAEMTLLIGSNKKALLDIDSKDSTINKLKNIVKKYKGNLYNATIINNSTIDNGVSLTTITRVDTIVFNDVKYVYPSYSSNWDDRWSSGCIIADRDSIYREIKVKNEYEITQGEKKQGFLKGKAPLITIKNMNPNTYTDDVKTFVVKKRKERVGIGSGIYYGIGSNGVGVFFGIGIQYNLITF